MNKVLKWILIGLGIALVAFCIAMFVFRGFSHRPMLMMGGRGLGFHHPFGGMMIGMGLFMLVRILFGAAVLGLAVFGIVSLFRHQKDQPANNPTPLTSDVQAVQANIEPIRTCVKCSKPLQADWKVCPYCGKKQ